jgi:hypothetical protein
MKCADYELRACRDKVFDRLCTVWDETKKTDDWGKEIWRKANTLQAVAQYWHTTTDDDRRKKAMTIIGEGYTFYIANKAGGWWVDDFGWWGGFFADLSGYTGAFPLPPPFDQGNLLTEMRYCYSRMMKNLDNEHGGIWNTPDINDPACEKNTITNSWMLNLAANLFTWTGEVGYRDFALAQYRWLISGKYKNYTPTSWRLYTPEGLLLWVADGPFTLGPQHPPPPVKDGYWSGDEGVFLRALRIYINAVCPPPDRAGLIANCRTLIGSAIANDPNSVRFVDIENVMHESARNPDWSNDLATGKGVFMRLVTRFAFQWKYFGDKAFEDAFKAFVNATAQSVWCSSDKTTARTAPNWNPGFGPPQESTDYPTTGGLWPQVLQTDGLDALNAALQITLAAEAA